MSTEITWEDPSVDPEAAIRQLQEEVEKLLEDRPKVPQRVTPGRVDRLALVRKQSKGGQSRVKRLL